MDDWFRVSTEPTALTESFDPSWPYNFKWGYDNQTGKAHVWRLKIGSDGRDTHRPELQALFGRDPQIREGDAMGLATYIPTEKKLDGTIVAPPVVLTESYFGTEIPLQVHMWFEENFPGVVVRNAQVRQSQSHVRKSVDFSGELEDKTEPVIKWVWGRNEPVLAWETDSQGLPGHDEMALEHWGRQTTTATDILGYAVLTDGKLELETYRESADMSSAIPEIKAKLAEMFPDMEIVMPDYLQAYGLDFPSSNPMTELGRGARYEKSSTWAQDRFPIILEQNGWKHKLTKLKGWFTTAGADYEGVMIALYVPEEVGKQIQIDDGEPLEDLHITLAYFVDKGADRDDWDEVERIVEQCTKQHPALNGVIGGYGVFTNDEKILWASADIPGVNELHHEIVEAVEDAGFAVSKEHSFTPHITLKYGYDKELPKLDKPIDVKFDNVVLSVGESDDKSFSFEGSGFEKRL